MRPPASSQPWTLLSDGVRLQVHLTPKSSRDALEGVTVQPDGQSVLKARVRALPEDGEANKALTDLIAKAIRQPKSSVEVEGGRKNRLKTVRISGDATAIAIALEALLQDSG